jgi:hypothetical protein
MQLEYKNTYDTFDNPIPRSGLFVTTTLGVIQEMVETWPAKQKADAYLIMQLTLNACNRLVQEEILNKMGDQ